MRLGLQLLCGPVQLDAECNQLLLIGLQMLRISPDRRWFDLLPDGISRKGSRRFADVPFRGVQAVAAIRNLGHGYVLAGREQVLDPYRDQCSKRNLIRMIRDIKGTLAHCRGMKIQMIAAYPDAVLIALRPGRSAQLLAYILLRYRVQPANTPGFPDIRGLGQPVLRAEHIPAQPYTRVALPPSRRGASV